MQVKIAGIEKSGGVKRYLNAEFLFHCNYLIHPTQAFNRKKGKCPNILLNWFSSIHFLETTFAIGLLNSSIAIPLLSTPAFSTLEFSAPPPSLLVLESSLLSISGCKFPFLVALFAVNDELLEFMETWGFAISSATCQPGNRYEYIHVQGVLVQGSDSSESQVRWPTTTFSSLAACIELLPVLTSTKVVAMVLGRVLEYKTNRL